MLSLFYLISHYSNLPFRAWEQRKLNDIVKLENGYAFKSTYFSDVPSKTIVLTPGNVRIGGGFKNGKGRYYNEISEFPHKFIFQPEDIFVPLTDLTPSAQMLGYPAVVPNDGIKYLHNQRLGKLTDFKGDKFFLFQLLSTNKYHKYIAATAIGTTVKHSSIQKILQYDTSFPSFEEQKNIGIFFKQLDHTIALHQRKLDALKLMKKAFLQQMFPNSEEKVPRVRFVNFDGEWEQRELGEEFEKVNERNDGSFGRNHWISVAKMYFVEPNKVLSNNIDTRTYVMRKGDIAFEGHPNATFKFGRFVANDIGSGIISELFPVYRHKSNYDNYYWKNAIQLEHIMSPIYSKSITSSGNSSNKLDSKHFLSQRIYIANFGEQEKIGSLFKQLDDTIILYQNKLNKFDILKKAYLQTMFI
ncbi:TPA: restriction endonuclease subunit S [Listeria monocytogenes]|uniref:restriction endonuclease subunit S n=2 Tax=Listeria monocytogenes TaxID=1639 RepID=UPI00077A6D93|nr:restriction endonuclease subunit S [Listeria monocytogenes]EHC5091371.1 restriction endonuclease subunit S [Listeria monocytogenes serotype 1/2a]EDO0913832.1 restriction endonuclease subunit S [Listeria monocytogenes]EHC6238405.1 restriction endonuclease subunit S [Listeria monocytogenes serotype 1/2a]EID2550267.1 restriction endonuclease subunit S [Listeria monocytogenes]EJP1864190.1 restriction endonuclease subunit S [Listeria monocytogenes]